MYNNKIYSIYIYIYTIYLSLYKVIMINIKNFINSSYDILLICNCNPIVGMVYTSIRDTNIKINYNGLYNWEDNINNLL